jgi:thioredoxin 1
MHTITPTTPLAFQEVLATTDGITLVDFTAAWCPPCRMIEPLLDQLDAEHADLTLLTVDVDESPALAATHGVLSMPTLAFFASGRLVHRVVGARGIDAMRAALDTARANARTES